MNDYRATMAQIDRGEVKTKEDKSTTAGTARSIKQQEQIMGMELTR